MQARREPGDKKRGIADFSVGEQHMRANGRQAAWFLFHFWGVPMTLHNTLQNKVDLIRSEVMRVRHHDADLRASRVSAQIREMADIVVQTDETQIAFDRVEGEMDRLAGYLAAHQFLHSDDSEAERYRKLTLTAVDELQATLHLSKPSPAAKAKGLVW